MREADEARGISALADLGMRGVWQPQTEALFDVRVLCPTCCKFCTCNS